MSANQLAHCVGFRGSRHWLACCPVHALLDKCSSHSGQRKGVPATAIPCRHKLLHNIVQVAAGCWFSSEPCGTNAFTVQRAFCLHGHADVSQSLGVLQVASPSQVHFFSSQSPDNPPAALHLCLKAALPHGSELTVLSWASSSCRCLSPLWGTPRRRLLPTGQTVLAGQNQAETTEQGRPAWSSAGMCPCTQSGRRGHQRDRAAARPSRRRLEPRCPRGC